MPWLARRRTGWARSTWSVKGLPSWRWGPDALRCVGCMAIYDDISGALAVSAGSLCACRVAAS